eukprot:5563-Heterococcus_DN1.PRE.2
MAPGLWLGDIDDAHDFAALNATGISAVFSITTNLPFVEGSAFVVQQRIAVEDDNDLKQMEKNSSSASADARYTAMHR